MYFKEYDSCMLCPRKCGVNRNMDEVGFCKMTSALSIGRAALHMWEEPCISGNGGSGTVFFAGCPLKCVYCQNFDLSRAKTGKSVEAYRLTEIFLELQKKGAHNINLVTGVHFAPHIVYSVKEAKKRGLYIPVVYNSSGYETEETIDMLSDVVDVFMPDFKYMSSTIAKKLSAAPDYPQYARKALARMLKHKPHPIFDESRMLKSGVLVRHLCLPSFYEDSKEIVDYLHSFGDKIIISIMSQYTPTNNVKAIPPLNEKLKRSEYNTILDHCIDIGIDNAYIQEEGAAEESFIPCFDGEGV